MSTIVAANISDGVDTTPMGYAVNGSAKVQASFNQQGTQAIVNSVNLASITDLGVGITRLTYTSAMTDAKHTGAGLVNIYNAIMEPGFGARTTTTNVVDSVNNAGAVTDASDFGYQAFGLLA